MHWAFAVTDSNEGGTLETNTRYLFHHPFWYLLWAGTSHVNVFFVMSGYVLSIKCLRNIHEGAPVDTVITSAVFRRAIRIFLPPSILLFVYLFSIQFGLFNYANDIFYDNRVWGETPIRFFEAPPPILVDFWTQFWDVLGSIGHLIDPYTNIAWPSYQNYDTHLWTMSTEYYCSIALYIVLTATCRLHTLYRLLGHIGLVLYCWLASHQSFALFFAGMTIAELNILHYQRGGISQQIPFSGLSRPATSHGYLSHLNVLCALSTWLSLYVLSMPLLWAAQTPGYKTLIANTMPRFMSDEQKIDALRAVGAVLLVWPITFTVGAKQRTPIIDLILANPVSSYLGRISFALYLVHGFIIRSIGYSILPHIYDFVVSDSSRRAALAKQPVTDDIGNVVYLQEAADKMTAWEVGWIYMAGYVVVLPLIIWVADLFWRAVDKRSVSAGSWLERKMMRKAGTKAGSPASVYHRRSASAL